MKTKSKIFLLSALCILSLNFLACKTADDEEKQSTEQKPSDDNKTYLQVSNNSQFDINVYFQSPSYSDPWATIKVGESEKKEISASTTNAGDGIYIQYLYPMGNIVIPYYDARNSACIQVKQIVEKEVNSIKVSPLSSLTMDTKYLIIKNESDADIALYNGTSPVTPLYQEKYWITSGNYRIYELGANSIYSPESYKLGNGIVTKELGIQGMEQGKIYSVRYSNSSVDLLSVTPIDISAKEKIWKIPLSQTTGKCLTADRFCVQENSSDGYFFTGQISYSKDFRNKVSSPYIAKISPSGEVSDGIMSFKDSPRSVKSNQVMEADGMRIVGGTKTNSDGKEIPFIYGDKGCDFYLEPSIDKFFNFISMIYKGNNVFAFLYDVGDSDEITGFGIFELTVKSYSETEGKVVYTKDSGAYGFINSLGNYVVLCQEYVDDDDKGDKSVFLFINDVDFNIVETKELDKYLFTSIVRSDDGKYAFASGTYTNSKTGKDSGSFIKIDLETKNFCDNGIPKLFPATESNLNSGFTCISTKNNEIFLAGYIDRNYTDDFDEYTSGYPYLVSYDVESDKVKWSQIYKDEKYAGFRIFSCYHSAIGTPLIEIYNFNTDKSYLASCGLLGEIPDAELASLPRSTKISEVKIPEVTIKVKDSSSKEYTVSATYGTEYTFADFNKKVLADCANFVIPEGKSISKWTAKNGDENKNVEFPLTITENMELTAVFVITPPKNLSVTKLASNAVSLTWSENSIATSYNVYYAKVLVEGENYQTDTIKKAGMAQTNVYELIDEEFSLGHQFAFWVSSIDANNAESEKGTAVLFRTENNSTGQEEASVPVGTYKWNFKNIDLSKLSIKPWSGQSDSSKIHTDYSIGDLANVVLTEDYFVASEPAGLELKLTKESGYYNLIDADKTAGEEKMNLNASAGCIDPSSAAIVSLRVKGPFDVKMFVSANSSSDKTDRNAFIKIGDTKYTDSNYSNTLPASGYWHTASYAGTDTVLMQFGGTGIVRIWDIVITTKE
ncbi:hypothetical protein [uncultured Treponema sp.]|uniref:hypothetical protein n=1 Tax=uncultured Treponema sp. TaxID=162155 RepID=UPI0025EB599B|nr:hypothetical protein [uncultured Treponema sp.]